MVYGLKVFLRRNTFILKQIVKAMLGFHSQNVPLSGSKLNHIYIKNKGTQKYTDLGELKGGTSSALDNALRVYIPGYGYAQEE